MKQVEGYISHKNVRRLLDQYDLLVTGRVMALDSSGHGGPREYDGISGGRMNKIMLDQAISKLTPFMQLIVKCRWTKRIPLQKALQGLGISKDVYYKRCDEAVEQIYFYINGKSAGLLALSSILLKKNGA